MSATIHDDDDQTTGHVNGGAVTDDDVREMLAQEQRERRRLKVELDTERASRTRAEATASTHASARYDAEEQAVTARIASGDSEAAAFRRAYSEALAEGRFDDAAEAHDKMAEVRAKQAQDRQYATWLTAEKARAAQQQAQPQHEGVDLSQYSAAQRRWIKANPDFMDDPRVRAKTFAGHQLAVAEGIEVDSPEYFEVIDETVHRGRKKPPTQREDDGEVVETQPPRRAAAPDMPVGRRSPQTQERTKEIRLSSEEREAADVTLPDIPVEGKYDRDGNWTEGRYARYAIQRAKLRARGQ